MYHILVIYALTNSDLIEFRRLGIFGFAVGASVGVCPDRRSVACYLYVCMYHTQGMYVRTVRTATFSVRQAWAAATPSSYQGTVVK